MKACKSIEGGEWSASRPDPFRAWEGTPGIHRIKGWWSLDLIRTFMNRHVAHIEMKIHPSADADAVYD